MQIPEVVFSALLWLAIGCVSAATLYLLVVFVREWLSDDLW